MPNATLPPLQWFCGGRDGVGKIPGGWARVGGKHEVGPERKSKNPAGWARVEKTTGGWARAKKKKQKQKNWRLGQSEKIIIWRLGQSGKTKQNKTGGWTRAKNQTKTHHAGPERKKQQQEAGPKQNQSVPHTPSSRAILLQDEQWCHLHLLPSLHQPFSTDSLSTDKVSAQRHGP